MLNRIGMVVSSVVESRTLKIAYAHHLQDQPGSLVPMLALWLFPQLVLVGIGEAFHFPGQAQLYYQEFPASLRGTATSMITLILGIGLCLSTALIDIVRKATGWLPDNINSGRLDEMYWTVFVLSVLNVGYYLVCSWKYRYRNVEKEVDNDSGFVK